MKNRSLSSRRFSRHQSGFTLVEILIVVIILGILAAIVIPQFTNASTDARKSNLTTQLQSLRQQIALYQLQHNNAYPLLVTTGWTVLTEYTDVNGGVSATADSTHVYGPYLESIPSNPLTPAATSTNVAVDASGSPGWVYSETLGKICATGTVSTEYFNESAGTDTSTRPW